MIPISKIKFSMLTALFLCVCFQANGDEDTFSVLGNGGRGTAPGYDKEALTWYQENLPTLPNDYVKKNDFVHFTPLLHYADHVNWSLFPLKHFKEVTKNRWIRVPKGTKIRRDPDSGVWHWPVGSETAKLLGGSVKSQSGKTKLEDFELRLARKIREDENGKSVWAMATYIKDKKHNRWKVSVPPNLELVVPKAVTVNGSVRRFSYSLTSPDGCMTCHSRGSYSNVDYKRGDEFVYGANEELISGKVKMRLSEYLVSDEVREVTREVARSQEDDWIQLEYVDQSVLRQNEANLRHLFE